MRLLSVFRKSMREQLRDLTNLTLMLVAAPFFIFLYWLVLGGGHSTYTVLLVNQDNTTTVQESLQAVTYEDGSPLLKVTVVATRDEAEQMLRNRDGDMALIVPAGFTLALRGAGESQPVVFTGDLTNARYRMAAILAVNALDAMVKDATGIVPPVDLAEEALDGSGGRTEFDMYVPGLLVIAVEMLLFKIAIELTAEVQAGTLRRLRLTRMRAIDLLGGISLTHLVIGVVATLLAFGTALLLGFYTQGPLWVAMLVTGLTTFSIIGFGLITACFARTPIQAAVVATFPMLGLMFFSGSAFPLPKVELFRVAGRVIGLYDILPTTHAVNALNKVMTLGAGLRDISYELTAVTVLSAVYFALGVWLFHRRHLRLQA